MACYWRFWAEDPRDSAVGKGANGRTDTMVEVRNVEDVSSDGVYCITCPSTTRILYEIDRRSTMMELGRVAWRFGNGSGNAQGLSRLDRAQ